MEREFLGEKVSSKFCLFFLRPEVKGRIFMDNQIKAKKQNKNLFTTKNIAGMAIFSALSFVTYLLEIPIMASTPATFLQLDFSNVFVLLAGFVYGPIPAIIVTLVKELIHILVGSTGGVGELANIILTVVFVVVPTIVYQHKKGIKTVILTLVIACILQSGASLLTNKFINFPFFMGSAPFVPTELSNQAFKSMWQYILLFNGIKTVSISIITILLYKRIKYLFKMMNIMEK